MDRKSLIITISILLGLNSSILLDYSGIHLPLARQVFGFVALTFLPGYLILKIFNTQLDSLSEQIAFQVALSVSVDMFMGIFMNFVYPVLGIRKPITLFPTLLTFDIVVLGLLLVEQFKGVLPFQHIKTQIKVTKIDLFFVFLPIVSLLSAYLFSHYGDNRGLLILYFMIALTPLVFIKSKNFNRTFAIWSIAISLMWSTDFGVSWNYIWGYDINSEYYYAHQVLIHGVWNVSIPYAVNSVASDTILAPEYSLILNMWVVQIFKIIYPLVFSLVPVILIKAYEKLLKNGLWAELSVLFFMFLVTFFTEMMALARQMIAEVYLAFLVYATIKRVDPLFLVLFLTSMAVSHYGTAYLTMFALLSLPFMRIFENKGEQKISNGLMALFWVVTLMWYSYVGGGFQFNNLVIIGHQTLLMLKDLFNPQYSQGLELIVAKMTPMREIAKWINLFAQGLISIGVLTVLYRLIRGLIGGRRVEHLEFYALSFVFFAYDIAGIIVPYFSNRLNATRLYQITLFFLSPYIVIGSFTIVDVLKKITEHFRKVSLSKGNTARLVAVFLLIYFLFNSGFMLVIANDPKPPMWLEKVDGPYWSHAELYGAKWLADNRYDDLKVYSDQYHALIFLGLIGQPISGVSFRGNLKGDIYNFPKKEAYIYFGSVEVTQKEIPVLVWLGSISEMEYVSVRNPIVFNHLFVSQKIYSSTYVEIYKT